MRAPPETRCPFCLQIFCCSEHRILHENKKHLLKRRQRVHWKSRDSESGALGGKCDEEGRPSSPPEFRPPTVPPPESDTSGSCGASRKRKRAYLNPSFRSEAGDGSAHYADSFESGGSGVLSIISSVANVFRNVFGGHRGEEESAGGGGEATGSSSSMAMSSSGRTSAAETPSRRRSTYYAAEEARTPRGNLQPPIHLRPHRRHPSGHPHPRRILDSPRVASSSS